MGTHFYILISELNFQESPRIFEPFESLESNFLV